MKYKILMGLMIISLTILHDFSHAQDSTSVISNQSIRELNQIKTELQGQIEINKKLLNESERNFELASKIIDWSAKLLAIIGLFLTVASVIALIAAWVTNKKFSQIDLIKNELESTLKKTQTEIENKLSELTKLRDQFEMEKDISMKILFPIVEGQWFFYQGQYESAITAYQQAYKIKPDHPQIYYKLNKILMESGRIDEAITNLEQIKENQPNNAQIHYRLGQAYRRNEQFDLAKEMLKKCLTIDSNYAPAEYELGTIYLFEGEYATAEKYLLVSNKHYKMDSGTERYWVTVNLAIAQKLSNKIEESILTFKNAEKSIKIFLPKIPQNPQLISYYALTLIGIDTKNKNKSYKFFQKAISLGLPIALTDSMMKRIDLLFPDESDEVIQRIKSLLRKGLKDEK